MRTSEHGSAAPPLELAQQGNSTRRIICRVLLWGILGCLLITAASGLPARWAHIGAIVPVLANWGNPQEQNRLQALDLPHPHDILSQADALLPRHAVVLLLTPGKDVGRLEYITYNRALYLLAPRAVWWVSPAPPDGTWKSRWWLSRPLTPESIESVAQEKQAQYVLAVGLAKPLGLGQEIAAWQGSELLRLPGVSAEEPSRSPTQYASGWWPIQVLLSVGVMLGVGWLLLSAAKRLGFRPGRIEGAVLAWSLGAGITTVAMWWLGWLGLSLGWQIAALSLAVLVLGACALATERRQKQSAEAPPADKPDAGPGHPAIHWIARTTLAALLGIHLLVATLDAVGRPLIVWDSWANWAVKARTIFLDGYVSPAVYADPSRAITQLDYPLMTPLMESWFFGWLGAPDDRLAGLGHVLYLAALAALLFCAARRLGAGVTTSLALAAAAVSITNVWGMAAIVFAEMPLIVFCVVAAIYMYRWLQGERGGALLVASVSAGLLAWTKREGLVLLACLCIGLVITNLTVRRAWIGAGGMLAGALALAAPWWLFVASQGITNDAFGEVSLAALQANSDRWPKIWEIASASLLSAGFGFIWPAVAVIGPVVLALRVGKSTLRPSLFLPVTVLLYLLAMGVSYLVSAFVPFEDHVLSSVDRILALVSVLPLLWLAMLVYARGQPKVY